MKQRYIPGVCNIGPAEIALRKRTGLMGLVATIVLELVFVMTDTSPLARLWLFVPAFIGAIGYVQASLHFCVAFGFNGLFNFGPQAGRTDSVQQAELRRKDQIRAIQIAVLSLLIAAIVTALAYIFT